MLPLYLPTSGFRCPHSEESLRYVTSDFQCILALHRYGGTYVMLMEPFKKPAPSRSKAQRFVKLEKTAPPHTEGSAAGPLVDAVAGLWTI